MTRKLIKPGLIVICLIAFYALLGSVGLPKLLIWKLPAFLSEKYGATLKITALEFNPFQARLIISGVDFKDPKKQPFVAFSELAIDVNVFSSLKSAALVLDSLKLTKPVIHITAMKGNGYNFSFFQSNKKPVEQDPKSGLFPLQIKHLELAQGEFNWLDMNRSKPETQQLKAINLVLKNFTTQQNGSSAITLAGQLPAGGKLAWQTDLSLQPIGAKGKITLEKLSANHLWDLFLKEQVNFKLPKGEATVGLEYELSYLNDKLQVTAKNGSLLVKSLQFEGLDNNQPALVIPEFGLSGIDFDLAAQKLTIAALETKDIGLHFWLDKQDKFNYQSLFAGKTVRNNPSTAPKSADNTAPKSSEPVKPWLLSIPKIVCQNVAADFLDYSDKPLGKGKVSEGNLHLNDLHLSYKPDHVQLVVPKGSFGSQNFNFVKATDRVVAKPLELKLGEMQFTSGEYKLDYQPSKLDMVAKDGSVVMFDFNFKEAGAKQPLVNIPEFTLKGAQFDLANQTISIGGISSNKGSLEAWLDKQGQLNYLKLFNASESPKTSAKHEKASKPAAIGKSWQVALKEFQLKDYRLKFQDNSQKETVNFELAPFTTKVQNFSLKKGAKVPINLQTKINQKGSLEVMGNLILEPFSSDLQVTLKDLGLKNFEEYLSQFVRIDIIDGAFDSKASIKLSQAKQDPLQLKVQASTNIKDLVLRDQILNKDLIKWQSLKLDGIDFDLAELNLNVAKVLLKEPYGRVTIKKDRTINFSDVVVQRPPQENKPKPLPVKTEPSKPAKKPRYKIGSITVAGGSSDFSDFSLILPFVVQINDLNGTIKDISSVRKNLTDFELAGKVFDLSPMALKGKFNPDFSQLDVGMHFKSMPLPFISPYMAEFAGYKIEKGKMSVDLVYKIIDRKLTAENNFVVDQLTLGEKVESPKAISLPLSLAIALLKDKNGTIKINMPLSGSLDDPEFSIAPLLWDAFVNLLTRVVTSPFSALGALASDSADMSQVIFKEGSDQLTDTEHAKLDELAKALTEKPTLNLDVKGHAYEKEDWPAMQEDALTDQLKAIKAEELNKQGKRQLAEYVELSEGDYQRLLADQFILKFPHLGKRSFFGTPELINSKADFYEVAKKQMAAIIPPNPHKLNNLASARARTIAQYLTQKGSIPHERVFILDSQVDAQAEKSEVSVSLTLNAQ